ncbi:MAG: response regulator, partial [Candidatus Solibacter sp.]|nr:response regulator [Candidatus Solibacter sp.]
MKRILFVDDEPSQFEGLRRLLPPQPAAWEMMFASRADAALRMFEACPFDVVVTGMRLPGIDGAQFLERVRDRFPSAVRIMQSGEGEIESIVGALSV